MPKIEVHRVAEILKKNQVESDKLRSIVEEMNLVTQPETDEEAPPALKKQYCILISDPNGVLPADDLVGWVLQVPEAESVQSTTERIFKGVYEFNTTKKGRCLPVKTVGEALEHVPAKHFKEANLWVKTKVPVLMLKTDNEIPLEKTDRTTRAD